MDKKIYCFKCCEEHDADDFTPFDRNPSLKDRGGKVIWCRKACNEYVNDKGNTLESLKEVLRIVDIPFIDSVYKVARKMYTKKIKGTNIVTRKNVYSGEEEVSKETIVLQSTIYSCYSSKVSIMTPKHYVNFGYSDGLRTPEMENKNYKEDKEPQMDRELKSAITKIKNLYGEDLFENKEKLAKAVKLHVESLNLKLNHGSVRQEKFKLKNAINKLIENGILNKEDYSWIDDKVDEKGKSLRKQEEEKKEEEKKYSAEWKGVYSQQDLEYLDDYLQGLKRDFKIITINHLDYARKIAKSSLHMDKSFDEMINGSAGAEKKYKEARETFDTLSKSAQFSENTRGQNDVSLGCFGKVFERVENHNWIPEWESLEKDDIDKLLDQFSNINKSL